MSDQPSLSKPRPPPSTPPPPLPSIAAVVAGVLVTTVLVGSTLSDGISGDSVQARSFLADKRNLLNRYFAKFAWAWTTVLLLPFALSSALDRARGRPGVSPATLFARAAARWAAATAFWFVLTQRPYGRRSLFDHVYVASTACSVAGHVDAAACSAVGGAWTGFDISGHCFLLITSALVIAEELALLIPSSRPGAPLIRPSPATRLLRGLLVALVFLWWIVLSGTALYFHSFSEKLSGTALAVSFWLAAYRYAFPAVGIAT
ncbi:fat storage-inducing transmembrane protein 2 [Cladochytrium tenue]|nr:fat storage-inducing transmembrane protein 2 [Cladochytrium tenue]